MPFDSDKKILNEILSILKEGKTFCLSGHQNPDADVLGSELAMASLLKRIDSSKIVDILNSGFLPRNLDFLPEYQKIRAVDKVERKYDVLIVFECSSADRMGNVIDFKTQAKKIINLDHHLTNSLFGTVNLVEPDTSSTAEIMFKIFEYSKIPIRKNEATCLYVGLVMDTGCFRYGNTNSQTHRIAARLIETGIPVGEISEKIYMSKTKEALGLFAFAYSNLRLEFGDRVALLKLPAQFLEKIKAKTDDIEEIVNIGLQYSSVDISVLLREKNNPEEIKVSLRSKGPYDIHRVAKFFGGGGHKNAAGCNMAGPMEEVAKKVLAEVKKVL